MPQGKRSRALSRSDDKDVFENAMRDVKPLEHEERVQEERKRPRARARQARAARDEVLQESLAGSLAERDALEQLGDELAYRHASLPNRTFQQLRRGRFSIEAEADLHGLTTAEAKVVLRLSLIHI